MATVEQEVKIVNKYGLHARPAMQFVELANKYASKIEVSNGYDSALAAAALAKLVKEGFGEM